MKKTKPYLWGTVACIGLASLVAAPKVYSLISSDFTGSHTVKLDGEANDVFSDGGKFLFSNGQVPAPGSAGATIAAAKLNHTGVAQLIVQKTKLGGSMQTAKATASLLDYANRRVLVTAAHVVGDAPANGSGVRQVRATSITANFYNGNDVLLQSVTQNNTGFGTDGSDPTLGAVLFPPEYDGVGHHGYDLAFIFLDQAPSTSVKSYLFVHDARPHRNIGHVKVGWGVASVGSAGQTFFPGTEAKRWGMNMWQTNGLGTDNLGPSLGIPEIQNSAHQRTYDFDNDSSNDAYGAYGNVGSGAAQSFFDHETHHHFGDSGCPSFIATSPETTNGVWRIAGIASYVIDMARDRIGGKSGLDLWTQPPGWLVDPTGPSTPDYSTLSSRTWGEFGVDTRVTDEEYGPMIASWANLYF